MLSLRRVYAYDLASDEQKRDMFDRLRFVPYRDFLSIGRLPRSSDGLTQQFEGSHDSNGADFIIFFSYRWINQEAGTASPDDSNNTQYRRMIQATEGFLRLHPSVNRAKVGIWVDHACIDQENVLPGVSALPMNLAQCNAVINLLDDEFYNRAWCSVEVTMVQRLKKSYNLHLWYEHVLDGSEAGALREGPMKLDLDLTGKQLSYEADRPKILFLDRQSKLLE